MWTLLVCSAEIEQFKSEKAQHLNQLSQRETEIGELNNMYVCGLLWDFSV